MQPPYGQPYAPYAPQPPPRRGMPAAAIWALTCGGLLVVGLFGVIILAGVLLPVFTSSRNAARRATCLSNLRHLTSGMVMYTMDYDQHYPPTHLWRDSLISYIGPASAARCPAADGAPGYSMNSTMSGRNAKSITRPNEQPVLFDSSSGSPDASDPLTSFALHHRGETDVGSVGYADGSVRAVPERPDPYAGIAARE